MSSQKSLALLTANAITTGLAFDRPGGTWGYQLVVDGTGAVSAAATVEGSHDGIRWLLIGTMTASGTASASDTLPPAVGYFAQHRALVTAISGTAAVATVLGSGGC